MHVDLKIKKALLQARKVCLVERSRKDSDDENASDLGSLIDGYLGLLIQTEETLFFYNDSDQKVVKVVDDEFCVKLEVLRGLND